MREPKEIRALFPGLRRFILSALFGEPERWWSLPELAGRAGVRAPSLRQHIGALLEAGVIRENRDDGRPLYQPDPQSRAHAEIRSLFAKLLHSRDAEETVLIVEDQAATAQITRILLESWGYRVLEAHDADEALALFERVGPEIDLLLTDVIMPGVNGTQLASELQGRRPELRVVFMSGYPAEELLDRNCAFLPKPFNPESLARMIRRELDRAGHAIKRR